MKYKEMKGKQDEQDFWDFCFDNRVLQMNTNVLMLHQELTDKNMTYCVRDLFIYYVLKRHSFLNKSIIYPNHPFYPVHP